MEHIFRWHCTSQPDTQPENLSFGMNFIMFGGNATVETTLAAVVNYAQRTVNTWTNKTQNSSHVECESRAHWLCLKNWQAASSYTHAYSDHIFNTHNITHTHRNTLLVETTIMLTTLTLVSIQLIAILSTIVAVAQHQATPFNYYYHWKWAWAYACAIALTLVRIYTLEKSESCLSCYRF